LLFAAIYCWWLVLICAERKVLLADCWWLISRTNMLVTFLRSKSWLHRVRSPKLLSLPVVRIKCKDHMHVGQLKRWLEMRFSESWKRRTYCISLVDYPLTVFCYEVNL
jgi:hypothetical protein